MKKLLTITLLIILAISFTGCTKTESNNEGEPTNNNGQSWPTSISYVPDIKYDGKGEIVDQKEDTSWGNQYKIYIKGSDLKSVNEYVDKLYSNGYEVMNMFRESGQYLKEPKENSTYKSGYENQDGSITVQLIMHDGRDDYDFVITWADTSE